MEQTTIVENYILAENYINTFLESSEEEYGIVNEAAILDKIIEKIKSIPKTVKLEIKKRTPEEIKKFKLSKQYKKAEIKLKKKAIKAIAKEYDITEKEAADKHTDHKLFYLINIFLGTLSSVIFMNLGLLFSSLYFFGLFVSLAYLALITSKTFQNFLDAFNKLIKSKTPILWDFITDIEANIFTKLNKNNDIISSKDESYSFTLDY